MKRVAFIALILIIVILQSACSASESDMWSVRLKSSEKTDLLTATSDRVEYGGNVSTSVSEYAPEEGNTLLLLNLVIEKTGTGKSSFSWADAHILDKDGNKYYRHPNDTFLTNVNMQRIKGSDITFGKEEGYVCFEIPNTAGGLQFIADNGNIKIKVS